jgi:hypothetical protein
MASLLDTYNTPLAREALLTRYPELKGAIDICGALLMAHDARMLPRADKLRGGRVAQACRQAVGVIQDDDGADLPVGQLVALNLIKKHIRDAALILPWPFTPVGDGKRLALTPAAAAAMERLVIYDPYRDGLLGTYHGLGDRLAAVLADLRALADGFALRDASE